MEVGVNRKKEEGFGAKAAGQVIERLLLIVVLAVCVVVPLYARDGYHKIGNAKFEAYRRIMLCGFGLLLILAAVYIVCRIAECGFKKDGLRPAGRFSRVSLTDKFVLAYLILTGVSIVSGGFYDDAFWGVSGWNMGFWSQLSFVLLYLFLSRFGRYYRVVLAGLCLAAAVVFGIGILHRLMIDPIGFYDGLTGGQKAQFLSTLGQATWYASFLAVTLPVGIGSFLYGEQRGLRIASGFYVMLGFCTLVTQNSDSAYFALAGMMFVFFMISCEKRETLCRFTAVLTMFFAAGKIMYLLMRIRPNPDLEPDLITEFIWKSGVTWVLFGACLALAMVLAYKERRCERDRYSTSIVCRIRRWTAGAVVGVTMGIVLLICLQSQGALPETVSDKISTISYLNWGDTWGNSRGRIWSFTGRVISEESLLHRIFGVGPDCFNSYVNTYHGEEQTLLWGDKKLTNAHNEWLSMLVNGGILGAAAYLGIYVTAVGRFLRGCRHNFLLAGIAASCVSYMCYNFFCYQQVLCTPFVFILMGIGEYILRGDYLT